MIERVTGFLVGSDLAETPRDRLVEVTLGLFAHKSGPNVMAGIAIGGILHSAAGFSPPWWGVLTTSVWLAWVLVYAVSEEVKRSIEERENRLLEPESAYYGIE